MTGPYIGIAIDAKSTKGSEAVAAVLLGTFYQEVSIHALLDKVIRTITPEQFSSIKDSDVGDLILKSWPFLDEVQKWMNTNPVGLYMLEMGYKCDFKAPVANATGSNKYGYGTWNDKIYSRLRMDLGVLAKKTQWFATHRPAIQAALKKTRMVAKVMES